jgi:hypothetical protein
MTWRGRFTDLSLVCGGSLGCPRRIAYRFADTLSGVGPPAALPLAAENALLAALDTTSIEPAVRRLAAREMEGRGRGPGNARAQLIVSRLSMRASRRLSRHVGQLTFWHSGDRPAP